MFLSLGLFLGGVSLWPPSFTVSAQSGGLGIILGSIVLVIVVALRCKAGFWAGVAAWVIGFAAILLYAALLGLILMYLANAKLIEDVDWIQDGDRLAFAGLFVIGLVLLLNRWIARRRRARAVAAAAAAVFD